MSIFFKKYTSIVKCKLLTKSSLRTLRTNLFVKTSFYTYIHAQFMLWNLPAKECTDFSHSDIVNLYFLAQ